MAERELSFFLSQNIPWCGLRPTDTVLPQDFEIRPFGATEYFRALDGPVSGRGTTKRKFGPWIDFLRWGQGRPREKCTALFTIRQYSQEGIYALRNIPSPSLYGTYVFTGLPRQPGRCLGGIGAYVFAAYWQNRINVLKF